VLTLGPALYAQFSRNVQASGITLKDWLKREDFSKPHVWRVLHGERKGSARFWESVGPWLEP
jgi:hypothetical protein